MGLLEKNVQLSAPADAPAQVEASPKLIALTFDDGPRRATTTALLDGLAQRGVKATFFVVGENVPGCEDLLERMEAEGHQIGLHSYGHKYLTGLNQRDFSAQVDAQRSLLSDLLGRSDFPLRPPYGAVDPGVERRAAAPIILWSVDPEDWKYKASEHIVRSVADVAQDGDVILLHDIYPTSVEAALQIVDALHQRGFLFVTVEELAHQRHVELQNGQVYRSFPP